MPIFLFHDNTLFKTDYSYIDLDFPYTSSTNITTKVIFTSSCWVELNEVRLLCSKAKLWDAVLIYSTCIDKKRCAHVCSRDEALELRKKEKSWCQIDCRENEVVGLFKYLRLNFKHGNCNWDAGSNYFREKSNKNVSRIFRDRWCKYLLRLKLFSIFIVLEDTAGNRWEVTQQWIVKWLIIIGLKKKKQFHNYINTLLSHCVWLNLFLYTTMPSWLRALALHQYK